MCCGRPPWSATTMTLEIRRFGQPCPKKILSEAVYRIIRHSSDGFWHCSLSAGQHFGHLDGMGAGC
jgi:hypothetical protein